MATAEQYAKWCLDLIDGNDHMVDEIYEALYDDGFLDENQEWIGEDADEE